MGVGRPRFLNRPSPKDEYRYAGNRDHRPGNQKDREHIVEREGVPDILSCSGSLIGIRIIGGSVAPLVVHPAEAPLVRPWVEGLGMVHPGARTRPVIAVEGVAVDHVPIAAGQEDAESSGAEDRAGWDGVVSGGQEFDTMYVGSVMILLDMVRCFEDSSWIPVFEDAMVLSWMVQWSDE